MSQININWQINPSSAKRSIIFYSILAAILLLYITKFSINDHNQDKLIAFYTGITVTILVAAITSKKLLKVFISKRISIESDTLIVPRLFLKDFCIDVKQINTLEIFGNQKRKNTIIISRKSQSPVAISEEMFMSQAHFNDFILQLNKKIQSQMNPGRKSTASISLFGSLSTHAISLAVSLIAAISFITFSQQFETLEQLALEVGGLTKNSLSPDEFYRLFASFFLHQNLPHLALNLIALGIFARPVELIIGKHRVINVLFTSTVLGSLFSLLISSHDVVVGASGGVLGLIGAYTALYFKYKNDLVGSAFIPQNTLLATLALQVISDIVLENIDSISHLFGFLTGLTYTMYVCRGRKVEKAAELNGVEKLYAFILAGAFAWGLIYAAIRYFER